MLQPAFERIKVCRKQRNVRIVRVGEETRLVYNGRLDLTLSNELLFISFCGFILAYLLALAVLLDS